jgi:deoxyribonuclease-4
VILGVHASVARGLSAALEEARALGCAALQILPYRRHRLPDEAELTEFRAAREALPLRVLLVHSRFVPCLASSDEALRARSVAHLARELKLSDGLGGDAYVLHVGAYSPGAEAADGFRHCADSIRRAAASASFRGTLLLENVPGGGRRLGGSLEDLARLREELGPRGPRLGFCLDTAHAWAAGYDLASAEGVLRFLARAHRLLGADAVRAFHLNDTRALLGSRLEHHWHWGKGRLGLEGLRVLLGREEFAATPGILETPKGPGADAANLALARGLDASSS